MILANPWGLLALLSIPVIIGLHFFRERKKVRRIGGLHLWDFAASKLPVGGRFDKLIKNLPLLFQILAALILSLLIAGIDIPETSSTRHYTILIDDSISMQAPMQESGKNRCMEFMLNMGAKKDRFTLITTGINPRIIAGPFADKNDVELSLKNWIPRSPSCNIGEALNLATRFVTADERILFVTDDPDSAKEFSDILVIEGVGQSSGNAAITFADRIRSTKNTDKIFITIQSFSDKEETNIIQAIVGKEKIFQQKLQLKPGITKRLTFETDAIIVPLSISIEEDALEADNYANLSPVPIKTVSVFIDGFGDVSSYFMKAVNSVPYTKITGSARKADLIFRTDRKYDAALKNRCVYIMPPDAEEGKTGLAEGRDIITEKNARLTENLSLEGVLWPYEKQKISQDVFPFISHDIHPLLYHLKNENSCEFYILNLLWDRTNIYRHTSWPVLIHAMVEMCRESIPGMTRSNFRSGEEIPLNLEAEKDLEKSFVLYRNNKAFNKYENLPMLLRNLPTGQYRINQAGKKDLAKFSVNLFAPLESDLRSLKTKEADMKKLSPATLTKSRKNMILYFCMLFLIILFTALSWVLQNI
jgi:aerotolerance regulator-like protein/VWA domain-containing protein